MTSRRMTKPNEYVPEVRDLIDRNARLKESNQPPLSVQVDATSKRTFGVPTKADESGIVIGGSRISYKRILAVKTQTQHGENLA